MDCAVGSPVTTGTERALLPSQGGSMRPARSASFRSDSVSTASATIPKRVRKPMRRGQGGAVCPEVVIATNPRMRAIGTKISATRTAIARLITRFTVKVSHQATGNRINGPSPDISSLLTVCIRCPYSRAALWCHARRSTFIGSFRRRNHQYARGGDSTDVDCAFGSCSRRIARTGWTPSWVWTPSRHLRRQDHRGVSTGYCGAPLWPGSSPACLPSPSSGCLWHG